jgi:hypothetical protein
MPLMTIQTSYFVISYILENIIADTRTCEVEATLALFL